MNIEDIRKIPITDLLARMGHEPAARKGNEWQYSAPYREERTPPFRVNILKNVWQDFGIGRGGNISSLAGEIISSGGFRSQVKFTSESLGDIVPETVFRLKEKCSGTTSGKENCLVNVRIKSLNNKILLNYLKERGICSDVILSNCEEIGYTLHGKRYFSVGFRNISGGYELHSRPFRGSMSPKGISLIDNGSDTCNTFEGFINYPSWMVLDLGCGDDYLVLNSVALLECSYGFLDEYDWVNCYLGRDEAGWGILEAFRKRYGNRIEDCSSLYKGLKDLNEYLQYWEGITKQQKNH